MSMMNDITQVGVNQGSANYSSNISPPGASSAGRPSGGLSITLFFFFTIELHFFSFEIGFMMFVDENPMMGGQPRNAQPFSGPRY